MNEWLPSMGGGNGDEQQKPWGFFWGFGAIIKLDCREEWSVI